MVVGYVYNINRCKTVVAVDVSMGFEPVIGHSCRNGERHRSVEGALHLGHHECPHLIEFVGADVENKFVWYLIIMRERSLRLSISLNILTIATFIISAAEP